MNNLIKNFVNEFKEIKEPIKVVSHLDADGLASGIYYLRMETNEFQTIRKMVFLK